MNTRQADVLKHIIQTIEQSTGNTPEITLFTDDENELIITLRIIIPKQVQYTPQY